jgi:hypothetical protein
MKTRFILPLLCLFISFTCFACNSSQTEELSSEEETQIEEMMERDNQRMDSMRKATQEKMNQN